MTEEEVIEEIRGLMLDFETVLDAVGREDLATKAFEARGNLAWLRSRLRERDNRH